MNLLDRIAGVKDADAADEPEDKAKHTLGRARSQHRLGLEIRKGGNPRTISAGQQRRRALRSAHTERRKNTQRYRRGWYKNRDARAVLRGQLWVIEHRDQVTEDLYWNTHARLTKVYGGIQQAREHAREIKLVVA